jgi:hypothetical protein
MFFPPHPFLLIHSFPNNTSFSLYYCTAFHLILRLVVTPTLLLDIIPTIEEILEEDGRGHTNSIILGDWNNIVGDESYQNIVGLT